MRIVEFPAHGKAQTAANRGPADIDMIVMHTAEGGTNPAYGPAHWFADARAPASSHYSVHSDGVVYRSVPDKDIAWHAGNSGANRRSLGIEIQGQMRKANWNAAQLKQAARLVVRLSRQYNIPLDRDHIKGHVEVSGPGGHADPGPLWDWDAFMRTVRREAAKRYWIAAGATIGGVALVGVLVWQLPRLRRWEQE